MVLEQPGSTRRMTNMQKERGDPFFLHVFFRYFSGKYSSSSFSAM